ncbi:MAG: DUF4349 domain-containing protein [Marmoricola sp.]
MPMTSMRGPRVATFLLVPLLLVPAACGVGASSDSGGSSAEPMSAQKDAMGSRTGLGVAEDGTTASKAGADRAAPTAPLSRAVISTGEISLHGKSVAEMRADVLRLVTVWKGTVADEQTDTDRRGQPRDSSLTLRVPSSGFSEAMASLADLGTLDHQSRKSEDVTTEVIDNDARVRAAERSIRQIELLLSKAEKIGDIIVIESNLAQRQADLDSLKSQQAYLADQTSMSTISVYLTRTDSVAGERDARGFLAGLRDGWTALKSATISITTALGAVLPFGATLALVGVPVWMLVRRRRQPAPPPAAAEA